MIDTQNQTENTHYAIWTLTESLEELLQLAGAQYTKEINGIKREEGKKERLAARLLINHLCKETKTVAYEPTGQPYLIDRSFHISISHTKGYVAVAIHPTKTVGIDIEHRSKRVMKIQERFMLKEELTHAKTSSNELAHTLLCWCAKEAAYKKLEISSTDFFEELHCTISDKGLSIRHKENSYSFKYLLNKNYCLVVG